MLSSLSRQADHDSVSPGEGWPHGVVDALRSHVLGVDRQHRDDGCFGEAREGIDESATDVVVYGMVRCRLPSIRCGEQRSHASLTMVTVCPQEKAGYMEWSTRFVPT